MTTHVLIVDSTTFRLHLEHLFVGTGARDTRIDFNNSGNSALNGATENNLVAMIADGCRIRQGDNIIFYLQQNMGQSIFEGKFFGIFKATQDGIFLDDNDHQQYLKARLGKSLTFRALIEPHVVYPEGVTEWEALDEIRNITAPQQMLWSLIYRKLKGNRGNTMVTIYEAERLAHLIRHKNNRQELDYQNRILSFDAATQRITARETQNPITYDGRKEDINLLPRLAAKYRAGRSFESHLQAYLTKNLGKGTNADLDAVLVGSSEIEWLGNEVSCGVGMQRIDVMASVVKDEHKTVTPTELKAVEADRSNIGQIQRYIDWIEQYYIPNRPSDIQPVLVAKQSTKKASATFLEFRQAVKGFNRANRNRTLPLKYVEFSLREADLHFEEVDVSG